MRSWRSMFFAAMLLLLLSAACAPQEAIPLTGGLVSATEAASPEPTTDTSIAAALQSVTVAHPPMQVGSIDRYFDGSLLDAVPNDGPFTMGGGPWGDAQRQITVSDFWIYSTEVSNQMYAWCVNLGKCSPPNTTDNPIFNDARFDNYPVVGVNWQQAADYCSFAHGRLPTEAEWEKAASWDPSVKQQRIYPWGDHDPTCNFLNFKYCLNKTTAVTDFGQGRSFYGVYNMAGNVYEWVGDWYARGYPADAQTQDPTGPATGTSRVIRSSGFQSDAVYASPTSRSYAQPSDHRSDLGFRCVVKDPAYFAPFCTAPVYYGIDISGTPEPLKPCPDPTILHSESCGLDNKPVQVVTVQNNSPTRVNVTGLEACDPPNNDVNVPHVCAPGVVVNVTSACDVIPSGQPSCPPDFHQDPNNPLQCISPGGPGACPAGFQYDTALQCCSAAPGSAASMPLCGVGQHLYDGVCISDLSGFEPPHSVSFTTFQA
ncbi:MAG: formylglycine-generating enzyme family protein, partial [Anaerolineae bacterium]